MRKEAWENLHRLWSHYIDHIANTEFFRENCGADTGMLSENCAINTGGDIIFACVISRGSYWPFTIAAPLYSTRKYLKAFRH